MRKKDTDKMNRIVDYINEQYFKNNTVPTIQEIARAMDMCQSNVQSYLYEMQDRGLVTMQGGWEGVRTKRMEKDTQRNCKIAIRGRIACGDPLFAEENIEGFVTLSMDLLGHGDFFALWAKGDSMLNAGISDGDLVLVRQQETAENGQIVVALCNEENATLKRFYKENGIIRLHPENDEMQDMYFDDVQIQGVAVKVMKNLY